MLISATVAYLNKYIVPGIGTIVVLGLTVRFIDKLIKCQSEDEPLRAAMKKNVKYIALIIMTTVLTSVITVIQAYYK
jgi:hypothetical protein